MPFKRGVCVLTEPPSFLIEPMATEEVSVNESVMIPCKMEGSPTVNVFWEVSSIYQILEKNTSLLRTVLFLNWHRPTTEKVLSHIFSSTVDKYEIFLNSSDMLGGCLLIILLTKQASFCPVPF